MTEWIGSIISGFLSDGGSDATVSLITVRSPVLNIARLQSGDRIGVVFDLSLMTVFDRINRVAIGNLPMEDLVNSMSALHANRMSLAGQNLLATIAARLHQERKLSARGRRPLESPRGDENTTWIQGLFAVMHELAHCRDALGKPIIYSLENRIDWWLDLMRAYQTRPEGALTSTSIEWTRKIHDSAQGAIPDELIDIIRDRETESWKKFSELNLLAGRPIAEVIDWICVHSDSELAEEVLCDAMAFRLVVNRIALWTSSTADRTLACVMAAFNLALLKSLETFEMNDSQDRTGDRHGVSDVMVRNRLLVLLAQQSLRQISDADGASTSMKLDVEAALVATDQIYEGHERLMVAANLWDAHFLEAWYSYKDDPLLNRWVRRHPRLVQSIDRATGLTRPGRRIRGQGRASAHPIVPGGERDLQMSLFPDREGAEFSEVLRRQVDSEEREDLKEYLRFTHAAAKNVLESGQLITPFVSTFTVDNQPTDIVVDDIVDDVLEEMYRRLASVRNKLVGAAVTVQGALAPKGTFVILTHVETARAALDVVVPYKAEPAADGRLSITLLDPIMTKSEHRIWRQGAYRSVPRQGLEP